MATNEGPAWRRQTHGEHRLAVTLAVAALITLQFLVPDSLALRPSWLLPAIEIALCGVLLIGNPVRLNRESKVLRFVGLALVGVAATAVLWSAVRLATELVGGGAGDTPGELLLHAGTIWLTNVIMFALGYWEYDRGGPAARANAREQYPDFLFPQMSSPDLAPPDWEPAFVDYLYLSFTNSTAFSPTDTMPLSRAAKLAMTVQSGTSLVMLALVVARAVNEMQ